MSSQRQLEQINSAVKMLKIGTLEEIIRCTQAGDNSIRKNSILEFLNAGVREGKLKKTLSGRFIPLCSKVDSCGEGDNEEEETCPEPCPKKRKKRCSRSVTPCCPPPACPQGCVMTFTRRCCNLERLVASESFEDVCLLRNPSYLECFTEEIVPEPKCQPAPECS